MDILHIDGNHDYAEVLSDLNNNKNNMVNRGIIVMDDTDWQSVNTAMLQFLYENKNYKLVKRFGNWSIIEKIY